MYKRILLTLDRSPLAEQALPHAVAVAQAFGASIELVGVVPIAEQTTTYAAGVAVDWESEVAQYGEYLAGVLSRVQEEGLRARSQILRGDVAGEILRHAEENDVDLVVMSTHGRSGLGRWVYGSIADRVLRHAATPVLLVRATEE
jgi:nucleotide-binding universal stress UspA family protein